MNAVLNFNPRTGGGGGDWPAGPQSHSAGASDGGWVVTELWDSRMPRGWLTSRLTPGFLRATSARLLLVPALRDVQDDPPVTAQPPVGAPR